MKYDPDIHHRRSIRLKGYDYAQAGAYFVTICTQKRECLFGHIIDGAMVMNDGGQMVKTVWDELPVHYANIDTDLFQIMPNHVHGIIIVGAGPCACPSPCACPNNKNVHKGQPPFKNGHPRTNQGQPRSHQGQPQGVAPTGLSLPDVVHRFKTMTTKRYVDGIKRNGWIPFPGKLWQRNYYEHVIRNENELNRIREYIINNPMKWELDRENPAFRPVREPSQRDEPWQL